MQNAPRAYLPIPVTDPFPIDMPVVAAYSLDEDRTPASRGFIARRLLRFATSISRHQAVIEELRAELAWSNSEWRRLAPHWAGSPQDAELEAAAQRLPHEQAAATALTAWGHVVGHHKSCRDAKGRLAAQRDAGPKWAARAEATAADLREHWKNRKVAWRTFVLALHQYREMRAEIDSLPKLALANAA